MGLIKALTDSVSNVVGDQFKEYVTCPIRDNNTLMTRGIVQHGDANSNPTAGVISNGSKITVPQGWAMMLVDNGKVVEFSSEPGEYIYDNSSEPSIFAGNLGTSILDSIKTIGSRITFGGQAARDQRVYYVNLLTVTGNKFGSSNTKKITDEKYGIIEVTFYGEYAYRVDDPVALVGNLLGTNAKETITFEEVMGSQMKQEFIEQVTRAISEVMRIKKVSIGDVGLHGSDISDQMNAILSDSWKAKYGIVVTDVAMGDINISEASLARINKIDDATIFSDAKLQSGLMATASADALVNASKNEAGAMAGFVGMGMAQNAGGGLLATANANAAQQAPAPSEMPAPAAQTEAAPTTGGTVPNFCPNCGAKTNGMNFCGNCGQKLT